MSESTGFVFCTVGALFLVIEGGIFWIFVHYDHMKVMLRKIFKGE